MKVKSRPPKPIRPDIVITLNAEEACRLKAILSVVTLSALINLPTTDFFKRLVGPDPDKSYGVRNDLISKLEEEGIFF